MPAPPQVNKPPLYRELHPPPVRLPIFPSVFIKSLVDSAGCPGQSAYSGILTLYTMADDTRQPDEQPAPRPRAPANIMPGGTAHTAGGEKTDSSPSYVDAVRSLGPE
jgi:hypothetical protein